MIYDYEYHGGFMSKYMESGFTDIQTFLVDESTKKDKQMFGYWNLLFKKVPQLFIDSKNLVLTSAKKIITGEPHKAHSAMLTEAIDSFTLKLFVSDKSDSKSKDLARLAKLMVFAYRLAEANERAIESTFFTFLIANKDYAVLKDIIVIIGFVCPGVMFLFVS